MVVLFRPERVAQSGEGSCVLDPTHRPCRFEACISVRIVQESQQTRRCLCAAFIELTNCPGGGAAHAWTSICRRGAKYVERGSILELTDGPDRGLAHPVFAVLTNCRRKWRRRTTVFDAAECPRRHFPHGGIGIVRQHTAQSIDSIVRFELTERPCCNAPYARRVVLPQNTNERRYGARRFHTTDGGHRGLADLLRIFAKQSDERIERATVFDSSESPRGIGAHVDRGIAKCPNERIYARWGIDKPQSKRRYGAKRLIGRPESADQLGRDHRRLLSPDQSNRHLAHTGII